MRSWRTWLWIAVPGVGGAALVYLKHAEPWTRHQIIGLSIGVPAFCLWAVARAQLGESFAIQAKAKQLVTHGLYAKIRNPIYLFGAILIAGVLVFLEMPYLFLLFLIVVPMQVKRIRNEERVLEEKFGDEYRAYKSRTWF